MAESLDTPKTAKAVDRHQQFSFLRRVRALNISAGSKVLLAELADRTDTRGGGRVVDPSARELADACCLSVRMVFRHVAELADRKLIRVETRKAQRLSAIYVVQWDAFDTPAVAPTAARKRRDVVRLPDGRFVSKRPKGRAVDHASAGAHAIARAALWSAASHHGEMRAFKACEAHSAELLRDLAAAEVAKPGSGVAGLRDWVAMGGPAANRLPAQ